MGEDNAPLRPEEQRSSAVSFPSSGPTRTRHYAPSKLQLVLRFAPTQARLRCTERFETPSAKNRRIEAHFQSGCLPVVKLPSCACAQRDANGHDARVANQAAAALSFRFRGFPALFSQASLSRERFSLEFPCAECCLLDGDPPHLPCVVLDQPAPTRRGLVGLGCDWSLRSSAQARPRLVRGLLLHGFLLFFCVLHIFFLFLGELASGCGRVSGLVGLGLLPAPTGPRASARRRPTQATRQAAGGPAFRGGAAGHCCQPQLFGEASRCAARCDRAHHSAHLAPPRKIW